MVRGRAAYWSAPSEAAVLGRYPVRGTEHGDFGGQFGCRSDEGFGPCGCGGRCPGACGGADLVGQFGDEIGATVQVVTPLRILAESVGYGGQPAQRTDAGRMAAGGVDAPIEHRGRVAGVVEPALADGLPIAPRRGCVLRRPAGPGGCAARASLRRG